MWEVITQSDIEAARQMMNARRDELRKRHEAELATLAADQNEVETLERMVMAFAERFGQSGPAAPDSETTPDSETAPEPEATAAWQPSEPPVEAVTVEKLPDPPATAADGADRPRPVLVHPPHRVPSRPRSSSNFDRFMHAVQTSGF